MGKKSNASILGEGLLGPIACLVAGSMAMTAACAMPWGYAVLAPSAAIAAFAIMAGTTRIMIAVAPEKGDVALCFAPLVGGNLVAFVIFAIRVATGAPTSAWHVLVPIGSALLSVAFFVLMMLADVDRITSDGKPNG